MQRVILALAFFTMTGCATTHGKLGATQRAAAPRPIWTRTPRPAPPPVFAQCSGPTDYESPEEPAPNPWAPLTVAVVGDDLRLNADDKAQLIAAVTAQLPTIPDAQMLPATEAEAAERLYAERRWRADGPVCGQPPPLTALLTEAYPNLILARVVIYCTIPAFEANRAEQCQVGVVYRHVGSRRSNQLPHLWAVPTDGSPASLVASVESLDRHRSPVKINIAIVPPSLVTNGHQRYDPRLRVAATLRWNERRLQACLPPSTTVALDLRWTINPVGLASDVEVIPVENLSGEAGARVQACVTRALEGLAWPCTPSGEPEPVQVRLCMRRS